MALRYTDGADHYAAADAAAKWPDGAGQTAGLTMVTGRSGSGQALSYFPGGNTVLLRKTLDAQGSWYIGFGFKLTNKASDRNTIIAATHDAGTRQGALVVTSSRLLALWRGSTQVAISTNTFPNSEWHFVEFKHVINGTTGVLEVRVDGTVWATFTGNTQQTANATANQVSIFGGEVTFNNDTWVFDDIYVCDGAGSVNNTYLGDIAIRTITVTGAGAHTDFTPSAGANYTDVDDATPNTTDYVSSSTVGNIDTYAFSDLDAKVTAVKGVNILAYAANDDGGARSIALVARPGTVDSVGSDIPTTTTYNYKSRVMEQNPDTAAAWTPSEVNASEFGVKVTV